MFIHFITWWQLRTQTSRMSDHIITPRMDWNAPDLSETFALFQQQMRLYFSVRNIKIDKQLDNLLLALGANGLKIYNSWSLDSSENNTDNVFIKFQDHLEPHANYWLSRFHLQQIRQRTDETVDNFVARIKLRAKKCGTRDNIEFEQRVIETIIAGIRYETVQRELLTKPKMLTLQDAVQLCRSYEVSIIQLRELKDVQHKHSTHTDQFVDAIKTSRTPCSYCGRTHTRHEVCPARGTFCKTCGKQNHWAEVCRSRQQPQMTSTTHLPTTKQQPRNVHSVIESPSPPCDDPKELYFSPVTVSTVTRDEALTHISVQLPTHPLNTACMRVKVDTGAQGNVLPLRVFSGMFPEYMDNNTPKVSVLEQYNNTKLTAYNGTSIPHYGTITLKCWKKRQTMDRPCFLCGQLPRARYYWAPEQSVTRPRYTTLFSSIEQRG